jgi:hypothetical protein
MAINGALRRISPLPVSTPVEPVAQKSSPPLADRVPAGTQPRRIRDVAAALGAGQHDPRPP